MSDPGMNITPIVQTQTVQTGSMATFIAQLTNIRNTTRSYNLVIGESSCETEVQPLSVTLTPGEATNIKISMTIPSQPLSTNSAVIYAVDTEDGLTRQYCQVIAQTNSAA